MAIEHDCNYGLDAGTSISTHDENWDMGFHAHKGVEISVVLEGKGCFECEDKKYFIEKGDIVLIQSNISHRYHSLNSSIRFAVIELLNMPQLLADHFSQLLLDHNARILQFSKLHLEQYDALFHIWLRSISEQIVERSSFISTWAGLFLIYIKQNGRPVSASLSISAAEDYIRTQLNGELKIGELSQLCKLSESSFRRAFHAGYGMSPKQYQQVCRMNEAKWLLRSSDSTIQQVAEQIGFLGVHAFSSWFHSKEGLPPSEWRKQQNSIL